jgi:hypothetical protein
MVSLLVLLSLVALGSAAYDPVQSLEYAFACKLAHCDPSMIQSWSCGDACTNLTGYTNFYSQIVDVSKNETLAFTMISNAAEKKFVIAYRSTVGNHQTLVEILQSGPTAYELANITGAMAMNYFYTHYVKYLRPIVIPKLKEAYAAFPDYTFVFSGHSLGAALTTLTAFDTLTQGIVPRNQSIMYNFGSPRVVNYKLAQAIEEIIPEIYRITHWKDIVPHIPLCKVNSTTHKCDTGSSSSAFEDLAIAKWPSYHVGGEAFYNEDSSEFTLCDQAEDPKCANQFNLIQTSSGYHWDYINVFMACNGTTPEQLFGLKSPNVRGAGHITY